MNSLLERGAILLEDLSSLVESGQYRAALDSLRNSLAELRARASPKEWRLFCGRTFGAKDFSRHPLALLLQAGPLGGSGALAARTVVHDPLALDAIYGFADSPQSLTQPVSELRDWELTLGFSASLRARRLLLARELCELGNMMPCPRVLAVGCGRLREAAEALALDSLSGGEFVAFDRDRACLDFIQGEYAYPGLRTLSGSLRDLTAADPALGKFDLIYLSTLLDTLEDFRASALLASLLPLLESGGRLLAANFVPAVRDAAYLEACLDWWPCYRSEQVLADLTAPLGRGLRGHAIFEEDSGGSIFLDLQSL